MTAAPPCGRSCGTSLSETGSWTILRLPPLLRPSLPRRLRRPLRPSPSLRPSPPSRHSLPLRPSRPWYRPPGSPPPFPFRQPSTRLRPFRSGPGSCPTPTSRTSGGPHLLPRPRPCASRSYPTQSCFGISSTGREADRSISTGSGPNTPKGVCPYGQTPFLHFVQIWTVWTASSSSGLARPGDVSGLGRGRKTVARNSPFSTVNSAWPPQRRATD